jgi:hypothetical protein
MVLGNCKGISDYVFESLTSRNGRRKKKKQMMVLGNCKGISDYVFESLTSRNGRWVDESEREKTHSRQPFTSDDVMVVWWAISREKLLMDTSTCIFFTKIPRSPNPTSYLAPEARDNKV